MNVRVTLLLAFVAFPALGREIATLRVGLLLPLSGGQTALGNDARDGAQLAVAEFSNANPEFNKKVVLLVEDDRGTSSTAKSAAEKLVLKDRVDVLVGSIGAATTLAIIPIAQTYNKIIVVPFAGRSDIVNKGQSVYRTSYSDAMQGSMLASFALQSLEARVPAVLEPIDSVRAKDAADQFLLEFEKSTGKKGQRETYSEEDRGFLQKIARIRQSKPQVLFMPGYYEEAATVMRLVAETSLRVTILGTDGWDSPQLHENAQSTASGHYFLFPFHAEDIDPNVAGFVGRFRAAYGRAPTQFAALAYDGIAFLLAAFKVSTSNLRKALEPELTRVRDLPVATGTLTMGGDRQAIKDAVIMETNARGPQFRKHLRAVQP